MLPRSSLGGTAALLDVYTCVYISIYICVYIYIYMYTSLSIYVYIYICVYIYIYMYRERERHIDRERERELHFSATTPFILTPSGSCQRRPCVSENILFSPLLPDMCLYSLP